MSYQVLARKWRPGSFREMVGQQHVLKALINALDNDRLHHAYLFTGTRGVGKTTVARILAKCLNCETGVTSQPCGTCGSCVEIAEGRSVDLLEVDAASRTKVEDTRDLLDNVQYAPTRSRYKIYLIDEVHMLSTHSFNALLKTLEEPPPHAKFLLATTDPQKLPATVLSRCLQFNLKNMVPDQIVEHLQNILQQESIQFDQDALGLLSRAAQGSMRDALSLTDQAIAFGSGALAANDVRDMLGTVDRGKVLGVVEALVANDGAKILSVVEEISMHAPDYAATLDELISVLHQISIAQMVPAAVDKSWSEQARIAELAGQLALDETQLFYQFAVNARPDVLTSQDPRIALEMALLRMLAFRPAVVIEGLDGGPPAKKPNPPVPPVDASTQSRASGSQSVPESVSSHFPTQKPDAGQADGVGVPAGGSSSAAANSSKPASAVSDIRQALAAGAGNGDKPNNAAPVGKKSVDTEVPSIGNGSLIEKNESSTDVTASADSAQQASASIQGAAASPLNEYSAAVDHEVGNRERVGVPSEAVAGETSNAAESSGVSAQNASETGTFDEDAPIAREAWPEFFETLGVTGITENIGSHCELVSVSGDQWHLMLDQSNSTLFNERQPKILSAAISEVLGNPVQVKVTIGSVGDATPVARRQRLAAERQRLAERSIEQDPVLSALLTEFNGELISGSIRPPN